MKNTSNTMAIRSRSASGPGSLAIPTPSLRDTKAKSDSTHDEEPRAATPVTENPPTCMPDPSPTNTPLLVVLSTSDKTVLPQAVHQVRSMVAAEGRDSEISYLSLGAIATQRRNSSPGVLPRGMAVGASGRAVAFGAITPMSIPMSIAAIPLRKPKIKIHFIRHAQVSFNNHSSSDSTQIY
jgi:hypothetical protein